MSQPKPWVLVAGAGPGLGVALAHAFADRGHDAVLAARSPGKLERLVAQRPDRFAAAAVDLTDAKETRSVIESVIVARGAPSCAVFNAGAFEPGAVLDISSEAFERNLRVGVVAALHVAQAAGRAMLERGSGTFIFTGATASTRGSARFAKLAAPKFALRALAQSMARELGPRGIHVAHVIIDGQIQPADAPSDPDAKRLEPTAIAQAYVHLHEQPRSAWTFELDLRPWAERW